MHSAPRLGERDKRHYEARHYDDEGMIPELQDPLAALNAGIQLGHDKKVKSWIQKLVERVVDDRLQKVLPRATTRLDRQVEVLQKEMAALQELDSLTSDWRGPMGWLQTARTELADLRMQTTQANFHFKVKIQELQDGLSGLNGLHRSPNKDTYTSKSTASERLPAMDRITSDRSAVGCMDYKPLGAVGRSLQLEEPRVMVEGRRIPHFDWHHADAGEYNYPKAWTDEASIDDTRSTLFSMCCVPGTSFSD